MVDIAEEIAEPDVRPKIQDIQVRIRCGGCVVRLQEHSGEDEHQDEQSGEATEAPRVDPLQRSLRDPCRVEVEDQRVEDEF